MFYSRKGAESPWVHARRMDDVVYALKISRKGAEAQSLDEGVSLLKISRKGAEAQSLDDVVYAFKDFSQRRRDTMGASAKFGRCGICF